MKKVFFYSPLSYTPHWEIELNLMEKYLREGWRVVLLKCDAELPACLANPYHTFTRCFECKTRKKAGIKWIGKNRIEVKSLYKITGENQIEINRLEKLQIDSIEQLKKIEIDGSDVGMAAVSSAFTSLRESEIDVKKHEKLLRNYLITAAITHFSANNHFDEEKPDEIVAFNGRIASVRPALRAAWKRGITTFVHESGKVSNRFFMVKNDFIHSLKGSQQMVENAFKDSDLPLEEMKRLAAEWFEERRDKNSNNQLIFVGQQESKLLPKNFSADNTNIVIFNSSEDEFVGFDEYKNPHYPNQNEGIRRMLEDLKNEPNLKFYVRIHPNLKNLQNSQVNFLENLVSEFPNLTVIAPESPIDSYYLLETCDIPIAFVSTIGIEAVYAGKTPILMGRAVYEDFGGIIKPQSHEDLIKIIKEYVKTKQLPVVNGGEKAWIKFGYFMKRGGYPLEFAEKDSWWNAKMKRDGREKYIKPSVASILLNKITNNVRKVTGQK